MSRTFNQEAFLAALERSRASRAVSWRKVAQDTGIEVTALHRILNGTVPDVGKYIALTDWLGVSVETFIDGAAPTVLVRRDTQATSVEVNCSIPTNKIEALHQVVQSAVELARQT